MIITDRYEEFSLKKYDLKRIVECFPYEALTDVEFSALSGVDALVLVTEWPQFRKPDFEQIRTLLKEPVIFDGRNQYNPDLLKKQGFSYYAIGRKIRN